MLSKKICITFSRAINPTRSLQQFQFCFQSFLGSSLSVLFLYSPHRQPPQRTTHTGRFSLRYRSSIKGTIHTTAPRPALESWRSKCDPKGQCRAPAVAAPLHPLRTGSLGCQQTPRPGASTWGMQEHQQDITWLLLIVTEIYLMLQLSKGHQCGKIYFHTENNSDCWKKTPHLLSTEFKGNPCLDKKLFVSLCVYQLGP